MSLWFVAERRYAAEHQAKGASMAGQIVHFEIPADDTGQSREFWGGLFGWQFESYPGPSEYHMTQIGAADRRGNHQHGARQAGHPRLLQRGRDQRRRRPRATSSGARPATRCRCPSMGWFSTCTDPHGNEFGLWQTDTSAQPPAA